MHDEDRMANDKLDEGIDGFSQGARRAREAARASASRATRAGPPPRPRASFFKVFDLDGDGFITREEWAGTEAVFDALDTDGDGRISPEEMAAGLGGAFRLVD